MEILNVEETSAKTHSKTNIGSEKWTERDYEKGNGSVMSVKRCKPRVISKTKLD